MNERVVEQRLERWFVSEVGGMTAPESLRASVAEIPQVMRPPFVLRLSPARAALLVLILLLALAAGVIVSGAHPLPGDGFSTDEILISVDDRILEVNVRSGASRDVAAGTVIAMSPDRGSFLRSMTRVTNGAVSYQCFVTRADGVDELMLDGCGGGNSNTAIISPDGAKALFYDGGFFIADLRTGHLQRLPWSESFKETGTGGWSPDGRKVVIPAAGGLVIANGGGHLLGRIPTSGYNLGPTWSPDGRKIAYWEDFNGDRTSWFVVNAEIGGDQLGRVVMKGHGASPTWSPDGRQIAYISGNIVRVVDSDGRNDRLLADNASPESPFPKWSPDGSKILYPTNAGSGFVGYGPLVVIDLATGTSRAAYPTFSFNYVW